MLSYVGAFPGEQASRLQIHGNFLKNSKATLKNTWPADCIKRGCGGQVLNLVAWESPGRTGVNSGRILHTKCPWERGGERDDIHAGVWSPHGRRWRNSSVRSKNSRSCASTPLLKSTLWAVKEFYTMNKKTDLTIVCGLLLGAAAGLIGRSRPNLCHNFQAAHMRTAYKYPNHKLSTPSRKIIPKTEKSWLASRGRVFKLLSISVNGCFFRIPPGYAGAISLCSQLGRGVLLAQLLSWVFLHPIQFGYPSTWRTSFLSCHTLLIIWHTAAFCAMPPLTEIVSCAATRYISCFFFIRDRERIRKTKDEIQETEVILVNAIRPYGQLAGLDTRHVQIAISCRWHLSLVMATTSFHCSMMIVSVGSENSLPDGPSPQMCAFSGYQGFQSLTTPSCCIMNTYCRDIA